MKKIFSISIVILALVLSASLGFAQMGGGMMGEQKGEMKKPGMMMEEGMTPMMKQMMGQGMMMKDMMQMMMDMMKMQKKMMMGMKPDDKKEQMMEMDKMMENMTRMMSEMRLMMMQKCMTPSAAEPGKEEMKEVPAPINDPHKH